MYSALFAFQTKKNIDNNINLLFRSHRLYKHIKSAITILTCTLIKKSNCRVQDRIYVTVTEEVVKRILAVKKMHVILLWTVKIMIALFAFDFQKLILTSVMANYFTF